MKYISNNYILMCNFDLYYFDEIINYITLHEERILHFFGIDKLEKNVKLKL